MASSSRVTIRALAQAAGVSIGTVSRALKGQPGLSAETRAAVLHVAQNMGYAMDNLRDTKPRRILFLYNRVIGALTSNQFYSLVLHGAETACAEADVSMGLMSVAPGADPAAQVRRHAADALLVAGYLDVDSLAALRACDLPMALADHFQAGLPCINTDNFGGARQATRHLLDGGAQRPAVILGPPMQHSVALRAKGFRRALFDAGRLADPDYEVTLDPAMDYDESGREAMRRLLALPAPPDAVFAYNDSTALNAMAACAEAGLRIPQDICFVGYDDIDPAARSLPPLSTVRVDKEALGREAVRALIDGDAAGELLLPAELVVRGSSRPRAQPAGAANRSGRGDRGAGLVGQVGQVGQASEGSTGAKAR